MNPASRFRAEHGFYRDLLFTGEGVYRIQIMSRKEAVAIGAWPFVFLVGCWLLSSEIWLSVSFFLVFMLGVFANLYLPGIVGNRARKSLYSKSRELAVQSSTSLIPWSDINFAELSSKTVILSTRDKREGGRIKMSDFDGLKALLEAKGIKIGFK